MLKNVKNCREKSFKMTFGNRIHQNVIPKIKINAKKQAPTISEKAPSCFKKKLIGIFSTCGN